MKPKNARTLPFTCNISIRPGDIVFAVDREGRFVYWNANARAATGRSAATVIGLPLRSVFPEHEGGPDRARFDMAAVLAGRDFSGAFRLRRSDGIPATLYVYATAGRPRARAAGAEPAGVVFLARDVTNQVEVERAARQTQEFHRAVLRLTCDIVMVLSADGRVLEANEALTRLTGIPHHELLELSFPELVTADDRPAVLAELARAWKEGDGQFEFRLAPRAGEEVRVDLRVTVLAGHTPRLMVAVGYDITGRNQGRRQADSAELKYRRMFDAVLDAVVLHSISGRILDVNDQAARMFRYERPELLEISVEQLLPPDSRAWAARLRDIILQHGRFHGESVGLRSDRTEFPVELSSAQLRLGEETLVIMLVRDITERKRSEQAMRESELLHRLTLNAMSDPAHVIDRDYRIVLANDAFRRWTRELKLDEQLEGRSLFDVFPFLEPGPSAPAAGPEGREKRKDQLLLPEDSRRWELLAQHAPGVRAEYEEVFATGRPVRTGEANRVHGRCVETETEKLPISEAGSVTRVLTVVRDVTERRRQERAIGQLAETAVGFVELPVEADFYSYAGDRLANLLPGVTLALCEYDEPGAGLMVRRVCGLTEEELAMLTAAIGIPPEGLVFGRLEPEVVDRLMSGTAVEVPGGLYGALFGRVPEAECRELSARLGIERVFSIGLRRADRVYGNITCYLRPGREPDVGLLEAFAAQASIALERHEAEQALAESRERYSSLFMRAPVGIYRSTPEGRILMANPALVRMLGYDSFEEMLQLDLEKTAGFQPGYDRAEFKRRVEAAGEIAGLESIWTRADGTELYIRENARVVRGPDGSIEYYEGTVEDLTERHRAEEGLVRQTRLHELLTEIAATYINLPPDRVDETIQRSLAELGSFVGADRAYLFEYCFERGVSVNTHEWCAEGIEPEKDRLQTFPLTNVPEELALHRRGRAHIVPDVSALPAGDGLRGELEAEGVKSLITVPLMAEGGCLGFVGFDSVRSRREYTRAEQGLLQMFAQMLVDVRRHRDMEQYLRESRERAESYLQVAGVVIVALDARGRVALINRRGCELLGVTEADALGGDWFERFVPEDDRDRTRAAFRSLMRGELELTGEFENRVLNGAGGERLVHWHNVMLRAPDGSITGTLSSGEDITQRRAAEEALRESRQVIRDLRDSVPVGLFRTSTDGRFLSLNPAAVRMTGYDTEAEMKELPTTGFYADLEQRRAMLEALVRDGTVSGYEVGLRRRDGTGFTARFDIRMVPGPDGKPQYYDGVIQDVTAHKAAEEALRLRQGLLETLAMMSVDLMQAAPERADAVVEAELGQMAARAGADRGYIFLFSDDHRTMSNTHEWCATGIEPQKGTLQGLLVEDFPWWIAKLTRGEHIYVPRVADLPPDAAAERKLLEAQDIKSELVLPVAERGQLQGYIGLDWVRGTTEMAVDLLPLLQVSADLLSGTLSRARAETALQSSEARLQAMLETSPDGIAVHQEGRVVLMNPAGARMLGYEDPAELVGRSVLDFLHPDERDELLARMRRIVETEPTGSPAEARFRRRDGSYVPLEVANARLDWEGRPAIQVVFRDITVRRTVRQALEESEERYRGVVERALDGIVIIVDGRIAYSNPQLAAMGGYSVEEVKGRPFSEFLHPDEMEPVAERYRRRMAGEAVPERYTSALRHRDGRRIEIEIKAGIIPYAGARADLVFVRDITGPGR